MDFEPVYKIKRGYKEIALPDGCEYTIIDDLIVVVIADKDKKDALKKALEEVI